jgi:hypothetical protein
VLEAIDANGILPARQRVLKTPKARRDLEKSSSRFSLVFEHDPSGQARGQVFRKTGAHFSGSCCSALVCLIIALNRTRRTVPPSIVLATVPDVDVEGRIEAPKRCSASLVGTDARLPGRGREIWIDQAHCRAARGRGLALGQRGEDAVHPFTFQLAKDVHADGIAGIIALSPCRSRANSYCKRKNHKTGFCHENLQGDMSVRAPIRLQSDAGEVGQLRPGVDAA